MKINDHVLSLPPFISTHWSNVKTLFVETIEDKSVLVIILQDSSRVEIPELDKETLILIFETHSKVIEKEVNKATVEASIGFPLRIDRNGIEAMGSALHHNPDQLNNPELPIEVLKKIAAVAKILSMEAPLDSFPKPEPKCNCLHCQIARAIQNGIISQREEYIEEAISEEDLKFKSWDIKQIGENLYSVTNPIDKSETYNVFLGEPIGCTCGEKKCEHIRAVLRS